MTTPQILIAQPAVEHIKKNLILRCKKLHQKGIHPKMSVVLVGNNPASLSYIKNKRKMCEEVGGNFELHQLSNEVSEKDFLQTINQLNNDPTIHGIIIQLPVGPTLKNVNIYEVVNPSKDIDGFHPENTKKLYFGHYDKNLLLPCTPKGIIELLNFYHIPIHGKKILVIGRSLIVGKPLSMLLTNLNATVTLAHSFTENLSDFTKTSDIIVSAIGRPKFLNSNYLSHDKNPVIIDVGINSLNDQIVGDVNFDDVKSKTFAISPVPGGVGPMTVISLIENLITATELQTKDKT